MITIIDKSLNPDDEQGLACQYANTAVRAGRKSALGQLDERPAALKALKAVKRSDGSPPFVFFRSQDATNFFICGWSGALLSISFWCFSDMNDKCRNEETIPQNTIRSKFITQMNLIKHRPPPG